MKRQKIRKIIIFVSLLLFPVTFFYLSPYLILIGASTGIINGSFIVFSIFFLASIFLGRLWCGWLCPGAGLQDVCFGWQKRRPARWVKFIKYFIWVIWIGWIVLLAIGAGGYKKIDFFLMTKYGISVYDAHTLTVFLIVITSLLAIILVFGKRGFCHSACWMSPFMIIGNKLGNFLRIPSMKLKSDKSMCTNCFTCTRSCPMSLDVNSMVQKENMENSECVLCGSCIDNCPKKAINYTFK